MGMNSNRGSILILVLWILSILVLLSLGLGYTMSLDQKIVGYQKDRLVALYLAKAGVHKAIAELEADPTPGIDASVDSWFDNPAIFQEVGLGIGRYSVGYSVPGEDGQDRPVYGVMDEDRKVNLNMASREVLMNLPGVTGEMADSIQDWRDEDPFPNLLGAEDFYYGTLELPYTAKNRPFEVLEELLLIRGMTPEVFNLVKPLLTVYSDGRVNLNTAPLEVMVALGMSERLASKVLRFRRGGDGVEYTVDDQAFTSLGSAEQELNAFESLAPQEAAELTNLVSQNLLKVKSQVFRISVRSEVREGKITRSVEAIVRRDMKNGAAPTTSTSLLSWHVD